MNFISNTNEKISANNDIECYCKIKRHSNINPDEDEICEDLYFIDYIDKQIPNGISLNETQFENTDLEDIEYDDNNQYFKIKSGFVFTFEEKEDAECSEVMAMNFYDKYEVVGELYKCIIPKNELYIECVNEYGDKIYASKKIILIEKVA